MLEKFGSLGSGEMRIDNVVGDSRGRCLAPSVEFTFVISLHTKESSR